MELVSSKILIVDNEIEICNLFKDFFDFIGYSSTYETDGKKVLDQLETLEYDLLFVDLKLGNISGIEILKKSKQCHPVAEVIVVTGYGSEETVLKTLQYGAFSYIQKPLSFSDVRINADEALAKQRFNIKTDMLRKTLVSVDEKLHKHFETILNLENLSKFLNLTIDIDLLADSLLNGMANMIKGKYYLFFFHDEINKEMVIHSSIPVSKNMAMFLEKKIFTSYTRLTNREIENSYNLRVTISSDDDNGSFEEPPCLFVPVLIEDSIRAIIGVSGFEEPESEIEDIIKLIVKKASYALSNAAIHRNTKLLAITDGLTGLLNHRAFHDRMRQEYERFRRYGSNLSIIIADFDNLKIINDTYGHPVGDRVLRKVGEILREASRETDILARYGGDEFVMLLPQTNTHNALNVAERISKKICENPVIYQGKKINASVTMGLSTLSPDNKSSSSDLLESADRALYEAKRAGKNRIIVADKN